MPIIFGYTFSIWIYLFHLGIPFSFGYTCTCLIWVCSFFIWVYLFHLGIAFSFGYTCFIWVCSFFTWVYLFHFGTGTGTVASSPYMRILIVWLCGGGTTSRARAPCCDHKYAKHPSAWYVRIIYMYVRAYTTHACMRVRVYSNGRSSGHVLGTETSKPRRPGVCLASAKLWKEVWATARKLLPK